MVRYGFSMAEVRQLYIDEFHEYFKALARTLENEGILKSGASSRIDPQGSQSDDLRELKKGLGMIAKGGKKK